MKTKDKQKLPVVLSREEVRQLLGHSSLDQTLVYTHLTEISEEQTQRATAPLAAALRGGA